MTDIKENTSGQGGGREIKFRFFDGNRNDMIYSSDTLTNGWIIDNFKNIMQYTGLKDKNGVEIYEGDILQYYMGGKKMGGKVHYKDGSFWITFYRTPTTRRTQIISAFLSDKRRSVIIGNIYQNTKLLSDK